MKTAQFSTPSLRSYPLFPLFNLLIALDIPPILLCLKKSKMASADKLNDHSPEKICVYHRLPKLRWNSWYTRLSSSKMLI